MTISLTEKALAIVHGMRDLQNNNADAFTRSGADLEKVEEICKGLRSLERTWADYINYGVEVV